MPKNVPALVAPFGETSPYRAFCYAFADLINRFADKSSLGEFFCSLYNILDCSDTSCRVLQKSDYLFVSLHQSVLQKIFHCCIRSLNKFQLILCSLRTLCMKLGKSVCTVRIRNAGSIASPFPLDILYERQSLSDGFVRLRYR